MPVGWSLGCCKSTACLQAQDLSYCIAMLKSIHDALMQRDHGDRSEFVEFLPGASLHQRLRAQGRTVVDIAAGGGSIDDRMARTMQAMHQGAEVTRSPADPDAKAGRLTAGAPLAACSEAFGPMWQAVTSRT